MRLTALVVLVALAPGMAVGQIGTPFGESSAVEEPAGQEATIEVGAPTVPDDEITARLRDIFAELDGLEGVQVSVESGVVELGGTVLGADARRRAERLSERIRGVVDVQNGIEIERGVGSRLRPALRELQSDALDLVAALPLAAVGLVIILLLWGLGRLITHPGIAFLRFVRNSFARSLVNQVIRASLILVGILLALNLVDASGLVTSILGAIGLIGLALGFAVRDTVENYVASVLLSLRQPFRPGELVRIEDREGFILRMTSRATLLMSLDGNQVRIPNATVFKGIVVNYTREPKRRFSAALAIDPGNDLTLAQRVALEALEATSGIESSPAPACLIEAPDPATLCIALYAWVDQSQHDYLKVRSEAVRRVQGRLIAEGVIPPTPTYRIERVAEDGAVGAGEGAEAGSGAMQDTRADRGLQQQAVRELEDEGGTDLLDTRAPQE